MRTITLLKEILYEKGITLTDIANSLSKRLNKSYSLANLSNKLRNDTITYREMSMIADILNCDLKFVERN